MNDGPVRGTPAPGRRSPFGAALGGDGANGGVFARGCDAVERRLFDRVDDARPARVIERVVRAESYRVDSRAIAFVAASAG